MENDFVVGKPVWLLLDDDWQTAEVYENKGGQVTFKTDQDKKYEFPVNTISRQMVAPMHHTSIEGVEDMAKLGDLHEASILFNLRKRYGKNDIYTHIGSILVAVNPYKSIDTLYDKDKINSYDNKYLGDLPPHIYAISNEAYYAMWRKGGNQCVLISGESGAGKTESTKHILRFLSQMSINSFLKNPSLQTQSQQSGRVEEVILQSSPILEAFGNSKTIYNNNSSRFGKFIQLHFSNQGNITGGLIIDYLLEKNRVVRQNPGERNFHIFYEICAGISAQQRSVYHLYNAEKYYYLSQSGCISDASLDDQQDYLNVINAMKVIGLTDEQIDNVHHVISSILQLGNINFITTGGAQVQDRNVLENLSNLLQVDLYQLNDALTQKSMTLRGEEILSPLTVEQAVDSRDSVAMALYQACFKWLILKINKKLKGLNDFFSLGVLDIFGFENFQVNRFEQFNINFANEKLQEYFNKHIFSLEQLEYNREGLQWTDIDWNDNGECLDLVEKRLGLLSLIDEESRFPKATDKTLLQKLHENHASNSFYVKPRVADKRFGIRHYAGEVFYEITGFLEKNRDEFREDLLSTLKESRSDFIYDLFDTLKKSQEESNANMKRKKPRKPTVSSQFKDSLFSLMSNLNNANPYFVRCVKPNNSKVKEKFEAEIVLNQLKYSGMLETVKIRKAGFPVRRTYEDFMMRYKCLFYKMKQKMLVDSKDNCIVILTQFDPKRELHRIGNTKIFLKDKLEAEIEIHRNRNLGLASSAIANRIYGYYVRKKYLEKRKGILLIQKIYKGHYYRDKYLKQRNATIVIQKYERRRQAKKLYEELLEQKRIEEERKREEERRRLEEERKEMERLEQQKKMQELEELRQKRDEEERIRKEEEEAKRVKEEMQRQAELARMKELEGQRRAEEERKRLEEERLQQEEIERLQQEEERLKLEEVERLQKVEEDRINQEELERKHLEEQEDALRQMAELDAQLLLEEAMEEEEDFEDDNISMICNEDYSTVEHSAMEGYLSLKGGLMNTARKHWCVLKDDTLMWFRGKQKALKSGWMLKKGGGTGTLSRRNWKRRWFILKDAVLTYHDSDQEGAKTLGTIDLRHCRQIVDSSHKDNALSLITSERTYHFIAESQQDWNDWHSILNRVHRANESELKEMKEESANIRNAVGTIDTIVIESISLDISEEKSKYSNISYATLSSSEQTSYPVMFDSSLPPDRSSSISKKRNTLKSRVLDKPTATLRRKDHSRENSFSIITADRVFTFQAETVDEVTKWVDALDASKSKQLEEGNTVSIEKGWMLKRAPNDQGRDKRRWFILTANSLDYYKSSEKNSLKLGSIILNSLCTVVPPPPHDDPKAKESGQWEFVINGRKRSYNLILPSFEEATKWQMALQEVVNNKPTILTPYDNLIDDIMSENTNESYIGRIYRVNPLLNYTKQPLKMSLLPLPYGYSIAQKAQNKGYGTFHEEALGIFSSLQELDLVADPIAVTQGILQTCHDLKQIRDEVYCQLIKQTTGHDNPNSLTALRHMQVLLCMCCTFLPSRKVLRFLRFHLKRMQQIYLNCEISKFAEFALEALKKTRVREFPPSREEIITLLGRRKLHATVYCYGGGSCQITIDSATTSGEVVKILCKGLKMQQENLIFALFERCGPSNEKSIEDRQIIADVLAKFERYKAMDVNKPKRYKWQLFFKIFCFLHPKNVPEDTVEGTFLFEQTCENVLRGRYQLPELTLCKLAALRLQYWEGDYISGSWIDSEIRTVFPVIKLRKKAAQENKPAPKKDYGTIKGTLRKAISPWKAEEEMSEQPKFNIDEELSAIKSNVMTKWRELQGTEPEIAQIEYMNIIKNWPGFGSTVFNVISKDPSSPTPELAIGVSFNHVAIYRRDETRPLAIYNYEDILSFGAPQPNLYRIIVQGRSPLQFETEKVVEIAKLMKAYINEIVKTARRQSVQLRQSLQMIGDENKHPGYIVEEQTKI